MALVAKKRAETFEVRYSIGPRRRSSPSRRGGTPLPRLLTQEIWLGEVPSQRNRAYMSFLFLLPFLLFLLHVRGHLC